MPGMDNDRAVEFIQSNMITREVIQNGARAISNSAERIGAYIADFKTMGNTLASSLDNHRIVSAGISLENAYYQKRISFEELCTIPIYRKYWSLVYGDIPMRPLNALSQESTFRRPQPMDNVKINALQ